MLPRRVARRAKTGLSMMLVLVLLLAVVRADLTEQQLPGEYTLVPLVSKGSHCPEGLRVTQLELHGNARKQFFVAPHSLITVPNYPSGQLQCNEEAVVSNAIPGNASATVLYRSSDVPADRRVPLWNALEVNRERYFAAYEVGRRICNGYELPAGTISLWTAPSQKMAANQDGNIISMRPGFKYIYYRSNPPCFYRGDARLRYDVRAIPSPSPRAPPTAQSVTLGSGDTTATTGESGALRPTARPGSITAPTRSNQDEATANARRRDCFPGSARVLLRRGLTTVANVRVGDEAVVRRGRYSPVIALTHADASYEGVFVRLITRNASLTLSSGHYVPSSRGVLRAIDVYADDLLFDLSGRPMRVERVHFVRSSGLYAPVTAAGVLVVDGVLASSYTAAVTPPLAHALLAPVRAAPAIFGSLSIAVCELARNAHGCTALERLLTSTKHAPWPMSIAAH